MRVLMCCALPAFPPIAGAPLRIWTAIQWLREFAEVGVFSLAGHGPAPPGIAESAWCALGAPAQMETSSGWMRRPNGMPSDGFYEDAAADALRRLMQSFAPHVVVLETFWVHRYYEIIREFQVHKILDAHNVEADIARQLESAEPIGPIKLQRRILVQRLAHAEEALVREMDQIWVCSAEDGELLQHDYDVKVPMHLVPNAVNPAAYERPYPRPAELAEVTGPVLIFPAGFNYPPNQRAAEFLIHTLFPRIVARYPGARLLLPGVNPTPGMIEASQDPRIIVTGLVQDMLPYLRHSSVMVVPLTQGGGTRFKIIEAFSARVPVVSSAKGAEGLGAIPGTHYVGAETADEFEAGVYRVLADPSIAAAMADRAFDFARLELWERAGAVMRESLKRLPIV